MSSQTRSPRMGGNCWSRDLKVRRLLKPAGLDRRQSLTPPISLDSISSADTHKAISVNTHFERCYEYLISSGASSASGDPSETLPDKYPLIPGVEIKRWVEQTTNEQVRLALPREGRPSFWGLNDLSTEHRLNWYQSAGLNHPTKSPHRMVRAFRFS